MSDNRPAGAAPPTALLPTKLYIPPARNDLVQRSHLTSQLNESVKRKLTLISAPAGFGKTTLDNRTEGWIAGLQLAALSMQGRDDVSAFIQAFTGDDRYILDYLIEEVFRRQPEHIQNFLLQTSILDRLCGSLCDAVLNAGGRRVIPLSAIRIPKSDRQRFKPIKPLRHYRLRISLTRSASAS